MKKSVSHLYKKLLNGHQVSLVDVGASGGLRLPWCDFESCLKVLAFDPDDRALDSDTKKIVPVGLYNSSGTAPLYVTRQQVLTSIKEPNEEFLKRFPLSERFDVTNILEVPVSTLDEEIDKTSYSQVDFLKIDTQGSEYEILRGSKQQLEEHILGVQVEVNYQPRYKNVVLFPEIDLYLRDQGFQLFALQNSYWKREKGRYYGGRKGQIMMGDALYLKTESAFASQLLDLSTDQEMRIIKFIFIANVYGFVDFAYEIFSQYRSRLVPSTVDLLIKVFELQRSQTDIPNFRGRYKLTRLALWAYKRLLPKGGHNDWYHIDDAIGNDW